MRKDHRVHSTTHVKALVDKKDGSRGSTLMMMFLFSHSPRYDAADQRVHTTHVKAFVDKKDGSHGSTLMMMFLFSHSYHASMLLSNLDPPIHPRLRKLVQMHVSPRLLLIISSSSYPSLS
jgi:hypothetical protein